MDFQLSSDLVRWQMEVRAFVQRELQPHDQVIEETGVVPPEIMTKMARLGCSAPTPLGSTVAWDYRCSAVALQ